MAAHAKISVTVPENLLWAVKAEMQATGLNRSQVVTECIRAKLTDTETTGFQPLLGPSQEDFDQLRADVDEIKRMAQESGAM